MKPSHIDIVQDQVLSEDFHPEAKCPAPKGI